MHYYKKNIGDYYKKAGRLSMLQHGAYNMLIDSCYDRERFPTLEDAIDWAWASTEEEIQAVKFVLNKFFIDCEGVYEQNTIRDNLAKYHKNANTNKRIAKEREDNRRRNNTNRARTVNEPPPNHKPLTTNHKPLTKRFKHSEKLNFEKWPTCEDQELIELYLETKKKAKGSIAQKVIDAIGEKLHSLETKGVNLEKSLLTAIDAGWRGFEVDWVLNKISPAKKSGFAEKEGFDERNARFFGRANKPPIKGELAND